MIVRHSPPSPSCLALIPPPSHGALRKDGPAVWMNTLCSYCSQPGCTSTLLIHAREASVRLMSSGAGSSQRYGSANIEDSAARTLAMKSTGPAPPL